MERSKNELRFHPQVQLRYGENSINRVLGRGMITQEDADLIHACIAEYQASRHVSGGRVLKVMYEPVNWRRFIRVPYQDPSIVCRSLPPLTSNISLAISSVTAAGLPARIVGDLLSVRFSRDHKNKTSRVICSKKIVCSTLLETF
jgi:hypothetical protein